MKNVLIAAAAALIGSQALAQESKFSMTTGVDYSTGKYGQAEDTKITYVPFTGKWEKDRLTLKVTVPYLRIDGPGGVNADSRVVTNITTNKTRTVADGLGDVVLGATYTAVELPADKVFIDVGAKVKLPTASESKGLGSGKTDYTLVSDIYKTIDQVTLIGTVGRRFFGDPVGVDLRDVWFGSAGVVYKLDGKQSIGTSVDVRQRTTATSTSLREYSVFHSYKFNSSYKLQTYVVVGDTTSSVDLGGGMMLGVSW
ncbi:MAG: hypothetical protein LW629_09420 [Burkholderiales bacterium]|nr:hypothetical protein [Burkholderiales bacterium]